MAKFEKVLREFVCTIKIGENLKNYTFKAVVVPSYGLIYRLDVSIKSYENGSLTLRSKAESFYNSIEDLLNDFNYQYTLCENNLFTTYIKLKN